MICYVTSDVSNFLLFHELILVSIKMMGGRGGGLMFQCPWIIYEADLLSWVSFKTGFSKGVRNSTKNEKVPSVDPPAVQHQFTGRVTPSGDPILLLEAARKL